MKRYEIYIYRGILDKLGDIVELTKPAPEKGGKAMVVGDDISYRLYGKSAQESLKSSGWQVFEYVFENGEKSKNIREYNKLLEDLASKEFTRSDIMIALGGGVVGDLTGFTAATYLRGISFYQLPTTLLAAVDSSVGGKTGINLQAGKNLAGAFWQPEAVICDLQTLDSLPKDIFSEGISEIIKYGMIADRELFRQLADEDINDRLGEIIRKCVDIKFAIVEDDERDRGGRQLLNFGHTLGHAVEKLSDYKIKHGQAVAIGMVLITRAAQKAGMCLDLLPDLVSLLKKYNLPTDCPFSVEELYSLAVADKKRMGNNISIIVPKDLGKCEIVKMPLKEFRDFIKKGME